MLRPIREGYCITFELPERDGNHYLVKCLYKYVKPKEKYRLSMWLSRKDIDDNYRIVTQKEEREIDTQYISSTKENIETDISKIVEHAISIGYFDDYIDKFEYELKCFDCGNELFEKERLVESA